MKTHPYLLLDSSSRAISWLVRRFPSSDVVFACIKHNSLKIIKALFCTTAPPGDPACILCQLTITPKAEIKSKCEQKTSGTITSYDHLFSIIPRKSILTKDDSFCLSLIFYCPASCLIICPKFPPPLSLSLQWHHFMSYI